LYYDEQAAPITARWAFVFNAPRYAMGLPIVETADLMDGQLDFCTFRGGSLLNGLMYLTGVLLRRHRHWRDTHIGRAMRVRIESNEPVPYQLDGDPGGDLPLTIDVLPARVTVLVPREWAERAGKRPSLTAAALN
jgi:diacylglycerol kinase family enzyme